MSELTPRQRINYDIRPAKSTQRRMILELLRHVHRLYDLRKYEYIGFGSYFFVDFILFDRHLAFKRMISIEKDETAQERFNFCKPLGHIDIKYGESHRVLAEMALDESCVIWLDYDQPPCADKLDDIKTTISRITLGSVIMITMGIEESIRENIESQTSARLEYLKEYAKGLINPESLLKNKDTQLSEYLSLTQSVVEDAVRNRSLTEPCCALQILRVTYQDGNPMLTLGWWLLPPEQLELATEEVSSCVGFPSTESFESIKYASLTRPEKRFIERNLGKSGFDDLLDEHKIPIEEAKLYERFRRYAPSYAELEW